MLYRIFPGVTVEAMRRWLRIEVTGEEHLKELEGGAIISPNHSGCAGFDAVLVADQILRSSGRVPRILTYWKHLEFAPVLANIARELGCIEASHANALEVLERDKLLLLFPEGEEGSFKPSLKAYQLQRFRTGFVRLAVRTGKPIVPCIVIGAEETHINLARVRLGKREKGVTFPLPLSFLPLPAKWHIHFMPPLDLSSYRPEDADDLPRMERLAAELQTRYQQLLDDALKKRPFVYFDPPGLLGRIFPVISRLQRADRRVDGESGSDSTHSSATQGRRNRRSRGARLDRSRASVHDRADHAVAGGERAPDQSAGRHPGRGTDALFADEGGEGSSRMDDPAALAGSGAAGDSDLPHGSGGAGVSL